MPTPLARSARVCVVYNPTAGTAQRIEELTVNGERARELEFCPSQATGDARRLAARAARRGAKVVIAAGGDGTIREVVTGLMNTRTRKDWAARRAAGADARNTDLPDLLIIPMGTGNDLARTLELPEATDALLCLLETGRRRPLDLLRWSIRRRDGKRKSGWCVNVIAGGFAAKLKRALTPDVKKFWGPLAYARAALSSVDEIEHPHKLTIRLDDDPPRALEAINVIIANARYAGGGIEVAPGADPSNGRFEFVAITPGGLLDLAEVTAKLLMGEVESSVHTFAASARRLRISAKPPLPFNIDGDPVGAGTLRVDVVPAALHVLVPAETAPDESGAASEEELDLKAMRT